MGPRGELRSRVEKWVPAQDVGSALDFAAQLNSRNITPSLNYLGEKTRETGVVKTNLEEYLSLIREGRRRRIRAGVSVKPTQLGALVDNNLLRVSVGSLLRELGGSVTDLFIDAEDEDVNYLSWLALRGFASEGAGLIWTLQANRPDAISKATRVVSQGGRVRMCRGAYTPKTGSLEDFARAVAGLLGSVPASRVILATNAPSVVREISAVHSGYPLEVETLHGIHRRAERAATEVGFRMRRYIPFGREWLQYCKRRDPWFVRNEAEICRALSSTDID